ncbi:MAG TPA: hypothetical protein VLB44_00095 [Kofleriaceae bacterium]|nr:hypothetical protein [Kofleriaceae bacterium]
MRRVAVLLALVAGCGDNGPQCGYVDVVVGGRNVWAPMFAVDDRYMYYADYDLDGFGTQLLLRGSRDGGQLRALAQRPYGESFGEGVAVDASAIYWTGTSELTGNSLYASPIAGGETIELAVLPACVPFGVATNGVEVFAGSVSCDTTAGYEPSRVTAVSLTTGEVRVAWTAGLYDGDVRTLATAGDTLFIGTSIGVFAVRPSGTEVLAAGNAVRHLEVHGDQLFYSVEDEGLYMTPVAGGAKLRLYSYAMATEHEGQFAIDGDDVYIAEPPNLMLLTLSDRTPRPIVDTMGAPGGLIAARDGYAWWSTLVMANATGGFDTFSGGIERVTRPCD